MNILNLVNMKNRYAVFLQGIPYAVSPTGPHRWRSPQTLEMTSQCGGPTLRAYNYGSKCYQYNPRTKQQLGSEDCLFVNVWTPKLEKDSNLDVMVFIHGGGFMYKSGNEPGKLSSAES